MAPTASFDPIDYGRQVAAPCVDGAGCVVPRRALDESALVDAVLLFYPRVAGLLLVLVDILLLTCLFVTSGRTRGTLSLT